MKRTEKDLSVVDNFLLQLIELDIKRGELVTPSLDLDLLILSQSQLFDTKELAKNIDLADCHTISGSGYLHKNLVQMQ